MLTKKSIKGKTNFSGICPEKKIGRIHVSISLKYQFYRILPTVSEETFCV